MAAPITSITKKQQSAEELQQQKLDELQTLLATHDKAIEKLLGIAGELHHSGMLEAAESMMKAKEQIAHIAIGQVSREPVKNLINHVMSAGAAMTQVDPELTAKLSSSAVKGIEAASKYAKTDQKISLFELAKSLKDPDINRAIGFGLHFLKGMGHELKK